MTTDKREGARDADSESWMNRRLWRIQPIRDALVIALIVGLLVLGSMLRLVTAPLLLALALAYLVEPIVVRLTRIRRVSREAAAIILIAASLLVVVAPVTVGIGVGAVQGGDFAVQFARTADTLRKSVDNPEDAALRAALPTKGWQSLRDYLVEQTQHVVSNDAAAPDQAAASPATADLPLQAAFLRWAIQRLEANADAIGNSVLSGGIGAMEAAVSTIRRLGVLAFGAFLTAFFFFFISSNYAGVLTFLRDLIPDEFRDEALTLIGKMDRVVAAFIRGRITIAAIQAIVFSVAYSLIGVPAALVLGPVVAVLSIVPYLAMIGAPVSIVLLWLEPNALGFMDSWWWTIGAPIVVYVAVQALDDYILTPMIQGKSTGMDTPTILFASITGGVLAGFYGLLLAIPVAACLKVALTDVFWPRVVAWKEGQVPDPLPFAARDDK